MHQPAIALLFSALPLQPGAATQILPSGEFAGRDGRPGNGLTWKLSDAQGQALAAKLNARHATVQFNFDYEHQAMLAQDNGQPAPASGWVGAAFEWRPGSGLYAANVQWTPRAAEMIDAKEYRYLSPVIVYDKDTGEVQDVLNAALTNIPSLDMSPVAQARVAQLSAFRTPSPTPEQSPMNPLLKALLTALALPETATEAEATAAVAALKSKAGQTDSLTTEIAALRVAPPDPTKFVPLERFTAVGTELAALKATNAQRDVDQVITQARSDGKVISTDVEKVWRDIGKADIAQLRTLVDATPANPALAGRKQSDGRKDPAAAGNDAADPGAIARLANQHIAQLAATGMHISAAEAVDYVMRRANT